MIVAGKKALGGEKSQTYFPNNKYKTDCLPKNRIHLYSYSTYISFFYEKFLEDIGHIDTILLGHTNA